MSGDALDALLDWARDGGIYFDPLDIRIDAAGSRSAFARRAVASGEALVVVPRRMLITDVDMAAGPLGAELRRIEGAFPDGHLPIAVWLARERHALASRWRPYLEVLRSGCARMPSARSAAELSALTGTRAHRLVTLQIARLADDLGVLRALIEELATLSLADLTWGYQVATSRSFRIGDEDGSMRALVPIADLLDHGASNASWIYVEESRAFEIRARRALEPGEEVHVSYGAHHNARFLTGFGFALPDNRDDEVELHVGPPVDRVFPVGLRMDRRLRVAMSALARQGGHETERATLRSVADAANATIRRIDDAPAAQGDVDWIATCRIVRDSEREVLRRIAGAAGGADSFAELSARLRAARTD